MTAPTIDPVPPGFGGLMLFDFDGTLADTADDMLAAANRFFAGNGIAPMTRAVAVGCISGGARALLRKGGVAENEVEDARDVFLRYYEETDYGRTQLFPGVDAMLQNLNDDNIRWGIVTNKPRRYFSPIAATMAMGGRGAEVMLCGDDLPKAKPHPHGLLAAAGQTPPDKCCYVGDDWRDAAAAANAGMAFVAALWGYFCYDDEWRGLPVAALASAPSAMASLARVLLQP